MDAASKQVGGRCPGTGMEGLEARIVLSVAHELVAVGLSFNSTDGHEPFLAELDWEDDREISGGVFSPSDSGPSGPSPTNVSDLLNGPGGALRSFFESDEFDTNIGARFISEDGYPLGWLLGEMQDGSAASLSALIERSPNAAVADLQGLWTYHFLRQTPNDLDVIHSSIGGTFFNSEGGFFSAGIGSADADNPFFAGEGFEFVGDPDRGRFDIGLGGGDTGVLYLSKDKSVILYVDLDTGGSDDDAWMGFLVRVEVEPTDQEIVGEYRFGSIATRSYAEQLFGGPSAAWKLSINANGTYQAFSLADSDAGDPGDPESEGTWSKSASFVTLTDPALGQDAQLQIADNGSTLVLSRFVVTSDSVSETVMAVGTRIEPDAPVNFGTTVFSGVFDLAGSALVFDLRQASDSWSVVDMDRYALEEALGAAPADIEAFKAADGRLMVAITTADGLFVAERDQAGFWHGGNLTDSISGAENIISNITVFTDKLGTSYVAGLTAAGEVVTYEFDPDAAGGEGAWSYTNISDTHLTPRGKLTPQFVGPLISYVTDWNGLNIAGLNADGDIVAVWSGNGGAVWDPANLTNIIHAPPMASGLSAYLTGWGGINIVGLNAAGRVVAAWWVPGNQWQPADLTTASGGPTLTGTSLTSFVAPWGALNVAGLDADGDMIAYWWVPANQQNGKGWEWVNLTSSIPASEPRPTEQLQSQANGSHGGELNILGTDATTGDLLRLFWRAGGSWQVENVSSEADYV